MTEEEKYREENPQRDVAVVGLRDAKGRVFLVRTHKLADWWQPIGGGIDPEDVTPESAAAREIKEELGIDVIAMELNFVLKTPYDFGDGSVYFYEYKIDPNEVAFKIDDFEIIASQWFTPREAKELKAFPATKAYLETLE